MATKRKRKTSWVKALLFFILTPFVVWALAFLIWFYWYEITGGPGNIPPAKVSKEIERPIKSSDKTAQERIGEEDRRKLEEILKGKR
ncbi:MAG TPA: hypothetical protein VEG60_17330 [Candidatus Binatia bacterium]|nr:hypothetical protein [Candidatus Binatia bacterium]